MKKPTVAVVGLGQIGGSLAAALTRRRLARVIGVTRRAATVRRARRMGIVASAGRDLRAVSEADLVVLATPVRTLLRQIAETVPLMRSDAVLTDVGSTKARFLAEARRARPRCSVVGSHPMAGNERAGLDGCDPDLFEGRPWILIPMAGASPRAVKRLVRLVRGVGAHPVWMRRAEDHDLAVARISHVPYLLATALLEQPADALRVTGPSFRDATRVALSDPQMVLDFLMTNPGPVRRAAEETARRLRSLARAAATGDERALRRRLKRAGRARRRIRPR